MSMREPMRAVEEGASRRLARAGGCSPERLKVLRETAAELVHPQEFDPPWEKRQMGARPLALFFSLECTSHGLASS